MKVIAIDHVTLDGVAQGPGRPDEDTSGGFQHGGWSAPYGGDEFGEFLSRYMGSSGALLLGRRTYENFAAYWPQHPESPFSELLGNMTKYVASTTLREPLPWQHSVLLPGDAADAVDELRAEDGRDLVMFGSLTLARSLMQRNLIDEYALMIYPLLLGSGRTLFPEGAPSTPLQLVSSTTTAKGVILATYRPADSAG